MVIRSLSVTLPLASMLTALGRVVDTNETPQDPQFPPLNVLGTNRALSRMIFAENNNASTLAGSQHGCRELRAHSVHDLAMCYVVPDIDNVADVLVSEDDAFLGLCNRRDCQDADISATDATGFDSDQHVLRGTDCGYRHLADQQSTLILEDGSLHHPVWHAQRACLR